MLAVIIGRRRQGKSTLALALARAKAQSTIIFDPNDQFQNIEKLESVEALPQWLENSGPDSIIRLVPQPPVEETWQALADILDGGEWAWADYTLILDECSMLMQPQSLDEKLERFARTCPNDVHLVLTTHRPRDVHPLFRALATDWFVFQSTIDLDQRVLKDNFGPQLADAVRGLPRYHVAHYWLETGGQPRVEVWDRPQEWFVDIGRRA